MARSANPLGLVIALGGVALVFSFGKKPGISSGGGAPITPIDVGGFRPAAAPVTVAAAGGLYATPSADIAAGFQEAAAAAVPKTVKDYDAQVAAKAAAAVDTYNLYSTGIIGATSPPRGLSEKALINAGIKKVETPAPAGSRGATIITDPNQVMRLYGL